MIIKSNLNQETIANKKDSIFKNMDNLKYLDTSDDSCSSEDKSIADNSELDEYPIVATENEENVTKELGTQV